MHSILDVDLVGITPRVIAARAAIARAEADEVRALADAAREALSVPSESELRMRSVAAELACAVRVADRTMQRRLDDALTIVDGFPTVFAAWREGRISRAHVGVIVDAGSVLTGAAREAFCVVALERAERDTPSRLKAALAPAVEQFREESFTERHQAARASRCVRVMALPDGMAELSAILPAVLAFGIHDRLTQQAKIVAHAGALSVLDQPVLVDDRTRDHIRAEVFADLLLSASPTGHDATGLGAVRAVVQVTVPMLTLTGTGSDPADLVGRCPIDPATARTLAGAASGWDRVMTHPVTGSVLAVDRYTPNADQKRTLQARDRHCRFPGCRIPAVRCEIDHTIDAALGGPTTESNLAHLCLSHHTLKHHTEWTVRQRPGGVMVWTSPAGKTYTDRPPSPVRFVPANDPPPF